MIVSISSAQGQGKGTLLSALAQDSDIEVMDSLNSRTILRQMDTSLAEVNSDRTLKKGFQQRVLDSQIQADKDALSSGILVRDRSYWDIFAYALVTLGPFNDCSDWLNNYYHACKEAHSKYCSGVIFLETLLTPSNDGVRSCNRHFSNLIGNTIWKYTTENSTHKPVMSISTLDMKTRISQSLHFCRSVASGTIEPEWLR